MKPDINLFYYLSGLFIGSYTMSGIPWYGRIISVLLCGLLLIVIHYLIDSPRIFLYPICLVLGHHPLPMIDCGGEQFGKACGRCGVRV